MEENKYYIIPANYTDSGKCFGGLLSIRNAVETVIVVCGLGYLEGVIFSSSIMLKIIAMTLTVLPISVITMIGVDGDSLGEYLVRVFRFIKRKRKLHFKQV